MIIMDTKQVIESASEYLYQLPGHIFNVLTISKPKSVEAVINLTKIISKLSPLVGNLIEFNIVEFLNQFPEFSERGTWKRQDPGFPDTVFEGAIWPVPGFEIKAWFPLSTEITARFKDSQNHFIDDNIYVAMLAWLPEHVIYGSPKIIDIVIVPGGSVAKARDDHYHNPPDYLVLEPEDTSSRTRNLQQTNTNGYKFQGSKSELKEAIAIVESWGKDGKRYKPTPEYQNQLRTLQKRFTYRLDTNYAKMDRIVHPQIEDFKTRVLSTSFEGLTIQQWAKFLFKGTEDAKRDVIERYLKIRQ